ncbi:MAG: HD domain-containing phosphohydrolase [Vulcanimicrobiota bacterium]
MMIISPLLEANSLSELKAGLAGVGKDLWKAKSTYYLPYDESKQALLYQDLEWPLSADHQPGACALTLRDVQNQELPWPEALVAGGGYRLSVPIFHWGELVAVLCLSFEQEPDRLESFSAIREALGLVAQKVKHQESSARFMGRCKDLLVQAVEAQGKTGHISRCSKLCLALARMMDLSEQVQADLLEAAQFHDVGNLTFAHLGSQQAAAEHAAIGAALLREHPDLKGVAELVAVHHERYDGSGLPHGLSGNEVPLEGWVLALVEEAVELWESSFESFQSKVADFFKGPAKHHHPEVVDALCGLVDAGKLQEILEE